MMIAARGVSSLSALDARDGSTRPLFADCSTGSYAPGGIAGELLDQLAPPVREAIPLAAPLPDLIDRQALERAECRRCHDQARGLAHSLSRAARAIVVLAPSGEQGWRTSDELFLFYLSRLLAGGPSTLTLVYAGPDNLQPPRYVSLEWQRDVGEPPKPGAPLKSAWFPGLASRELFACFREQPSHLALSNGLALIDPVARRYAVEPTAEELTRVLEVPSLRRRYWRFLMLRAAHLFEASPLMREAWRCFAEGEDAQSMLSLSRNAVSRAASDIERGRSMLEAQRLRICLRAVDDDIIADDIFGRPIPQGLGVALAQSKGWLLALKKEPRRSAPYLTQSITALEQTGHVRELLYLLNIAAYNELNSGNLASALELEERIAAALSRGEVDDRRLAFLNHLNLSRLHEMRDSHSAAQAQLDECARLLDGYALASLDMFVSFRQARLAETRARGRNGRKPWLSCALHWVSSRFPEAIPDRLAAALDKPLKHDLLQRVEGVAMRLLLALRDTDGLSHRPLSRPAFVRASEVDVASYGKLTVVASPAGPLLASSAETHHVSLAHESAAFRELQRVVGVLTAELLPRGHDGFRTLIVDDVWTGQDPRTALASSLLRYGVSNFVHERRAYQVPADLRAELERGATVSPNPGLAGIEYAGGQPRARFQRFLPPVALEDDEARILDRCTARPLLRELYDSEPGRVEWPSFLARLRRMATARLLCVSAPLPPFAAFLDAHAEPLNEGIPA
jgi:hypothetical protein